MAKEFKIYKVFWEYWWDDGYNVHRGELDRGKIFYVDTSPENALERFKKTPEYEYHRQFAPEETFKVREVSKVYVSLPKLIEEDAEKFSIEYEVSKKGKTVTLELKVRENG